MNEGTARVLEQLRNLQLAIDEHDSRLESVEDNLSHWKYNANEIVRYRRLAVIELREQGASMSSIARTLKLGLSTIARDLQATQHERPARVRGLDGKSHPSRKARRDAA